MRLTFRRLLAYLDGVLEEQDVEVVRQKISESKVASQLIHRIKNAKTRERLGAPRVNGTGMGLDPNTVAEYLDYTLDEDRVPDFETVCFESDVHLAEVSASHEILTIVLAEPAQVERSIRERIYGIPGEAQAGRRSRHNNDGTHQRVDGPHVPAAPLGDGSSDLSGEQPVSEADAMREVAEYLDDRTEVRWRSLLLTAALSFLLVLVGLRAMGSFDGNHPLLGRLLGGNEQPQPTDVASSWEPQAAAPLSSDSDAASEPAADGANPTSPSGEPATEPAAGSEGEEAAEANPDPAEASTRGTPGTPETGAEVPDVLEPPPLATPPLIAPPLASDEADPATASDESMDAVDPSGQPANVDVAEPNLEPGSPAGPLEPANGATEDGATEDDATESGESKSDASEGSESTSDESTSDAAEGNDAEGGTPEPKAIKPVEVGLFNSPGEVIGRYRAEDRTWRRLEVREVVRSGDRLRVPPFYRPLIAFAGSLQVTVVGPADLEILPPVAGRPNIRLHFGRMIVESVATPNLAATLELGAQRGELLLKSIDSTVAISVQGYLPVGGDPESDSEMATLWNAVRGEVVWAPAGDRPSVPLSMGNRLTAVGEALRMPVSSPAPEWAAVSSTANVLRLAAESAEKEFEADRSMGVTLDELLNHRMVDIRSMATQSMTEFGNFLPFVRSLKVANREDNPNYFYRQHEYSAMRSALSRGPEFAKALRAALEHEFEGKPETVERLFRLCVSFSNQQLERGQAAQLIEDLSNEEQAVRILAFENLQRITGKKKIYNPLKSPELQRPGIASWAEIYQSGGVRWAEEPKPF